MTMREILEGLRDALRAPTVTIPNPTGDGVIVYSDKGGGRFEAEDHAGPRRLQRTHRFDDPASLAEWLNRHAEGREEETEILVSAGGIGVRVGNGVNADCLHGLLAMHPTTAAWVGAAGDRLSQRELLGLVVAHREAVANADEVAAGLAAFNAVSKGDMRHEVDELGYTRFAGVSRSTSVEGKIPPRIDVVAPFYAGIGVPDDPESEPVVELSFLVDLRIPDDGPPVFALSCPGLELARAEALADVKAWFEDRLEEGFLVGMGALYGVEVPTYGMAADAVD